MGPVRNLDDLLMLGHGYQRSKILLGALAALGLLSRTGGRYRISRLAKECLLPWARSLVSVLPHHLDGWGDWGRLAATIRGVGIVRRHR